MGVALLGRQVTGRFQPAYLPAVSLYY